MFLSFVLAVLMAVPGLVPGLPDDARARATGIGTSHAATPLSGVARDVAASSSSVAIRHEERTIVVSSVRASGMASSGEQTASPSGASGDIVAESQDPSGRVESGVVDTTGFQTIGVTWSIAAGSVDPGIQVRTRVSGQWSSWAALSTSDSSPDAGTADARHVVRRGTDPMSIGDADAIQLSFGATAADISGDMRLALIGSPQTSVTSGAATSSALGTAAITPAVFSTGALRSMVAPTVITRAQWGAPAQACVPDVASGLVGAVVHHTAGSNNYTTVAQAEQQIRNDAAYHINVQGWCDLGYNFVVDKWGNIYEGRAKSLTEPVVGAHAGGFNTGTVGVAMLGTYDALPSAATQQAVAQIIGWRLGQYGVDPRGTMSYTTGVGVNSRFQNQTVTLPRVIGHRDVGYTACPGNGGYAALPNIRTMAWDVAKWVNAPTVGRQSVDSPGLFRGGVFYLRTSYTSGASDFSFEYGNAGDVAVMGDWNGDGTKTPGVFRNGTWYLRNKNSIGQGDVAITFGLPGDIPVVGDWNGDGVDTIGVFRNGAWYLRNSNTSGVADVTIQFGQVGDVPVVGDWNGDGKDTPGVFRGGRWYLTNSFDRATADAVYQFGTPGDRPLVGDWNGDGVDTPGVYRKGAWYLTNAFDSGVAEVTFQFGLASDTPVVYR